MGLRRKIMTAAKCRWENLSLPCVVGETVSQTRELVFRFRGGICPPPRGIAMMPCTPCII
jgi:hypothetical protein